MKYEKMNDEEGGGIFYSGAFPEKMAMKVKNNYIFRKVAQESLLIPTGETALTIKGLVAMSESGSLLYQKLRTECSKEDLVSALTAEYEVSAEEALADVEAFLDQMRQLDMLVEDENE